MDVCETVILSVILLYLHISIIITNVWSMHPCPTIFENIPLTKTQKERWNHNWEPFHVVRSYEGLFGGIYKCKLSGVHWHGVVLVLHTLKPYNSKHTNCINKDNFISFLGHKSGWKCLSIMLEWKQVTWDGQVRHIVGRTWILTLNSGRSQHAWIWQ